MTSGDRGMITNTRIADLRELPGMEWITALRAPAIAALARDDGPLQMSLSGMQSFAEITHPDYPGERLICCKNPFLAADRARKARGPAGRHGGPQPQLRGRPRAGQRPGARVAREDLRQAALATSGDLNGSGSIVVIESVGEQDALVEQVGFSPAVHLSFDHLTGNNHRMVVSSQRPQADWPRG